MNHVHASPNARAWIVALHLSQLAGFVIPGAGFIAPIVIWRVLRDDVPELDEHGRLITNWLLTYVTFMIMCIPFVFVLIGIPMAWLIGWIGIVYPIIGGVMAADGKRWSYPGTIRYV